MKLEDALKVVAHVKCILVEVLMLKRLLLVFVVLSVAVSTVGCSIFNDNSSEKDRSVNIYTRPKILNLNRGKLSTFPENNGYSPGTFQVDLRSYDLTGLDLKDKISSLLVSDFDNRTKWPYVLPKGFDPKKIIKYGKNPGLGINKLHNGGIDGSDVGVAIIGGPILVDHVEYKKQLKLYKELNFTSGSASVEGTAAASVLAGKSTGVSPGVDLYYVAIKPVSNDESSSAAEEGNKAYEIGSQVPTAIDWILEFNEKLPKDNKIRVLCIQEEITADDKNYSKILVSMEKAIDKGVFIVSTISHKLYRNEVYFKGLGRDALSDPDTLSAYLPGKSWANSFYLFGRYLPSSNTLFLPSDSRCTASPTGKKDFAFYSVNDWNLQLPYAAGLYAMACQLKPSVTPEEFVERAVKNSDTMEIVNSAINYKYKFKNIVCPLRLIEDFKQ